MKFRTLPDIVDAMQVRLPDVDGTLEKFLSCDGYYGSWLGSPFSDCIRPGGFLEHNALGRDIAKEGDWVVKSIRSGKHRVEVFTDEWFHRLFGPLDPSVAPVAANVVRDPASPDATVRDAGSGRKDGTG